MSNSRKPKVVERMLYPGVILRGGDTLIFRPSTVGRAEQTMCDDRSARLSSPTVDKSVDKKRGDARQREGHRVLTRWLKS